MISSFSNMRVVLFSRSPAPKSAGEEPGSVLPIGFKAEREWPNASLRTRVDESGGVEVMMASPKKCGTEVCVLYEPDPLS